MIKLRNKDGKDIFDLWSELKDRAENIQFQDAEDTTFDLERISGVVDDMLQICTNVIAGRKNDL